MKKEHGSLALFGRAPCSPEDLKPVLKSEEQGKAAARCAKWNAIKAATLQPTSR
jgi:hypothetical protein